MKKDKLSDRIIKALEDNNKNDMSLWDIANHLYDGCMNFPKSGNGIKIANIRRSAENDDRLFFYVNYRDEGFVAINKN